MVKNQKGELMNVAYVLLNSFVTACTACSYGIVRLRSSLWILTALSIVLFITLDLSPLPTYRKYKSKRLRICSKGADMLSTFLLSSALTITAHIIAAVRLSSWSAGHFIASCVIASLVLSVVFWCGIVRVYVSSVQLGIRYRVKGLLLALIPIVNVVLLIRMIGICYAEVIFENDKQLLNESRKSCEICKTKYPILLVHGVFFRDFKHLNYWGRIPDELITNGAVIHYGCHQSALSVAQSAAELTERIKQIVSETGCEKVNIIAHSKGGLDCRYAIANCGAAPYVASLATINTPHRGCLFADYLLEKAPQSVKNTVSKAYNGALRKLGDQNPDFLGAVYDLTDKKCKELDSSMSDPAGIYCQSVGSKLNKASGGRFPLNFTYMLAGHFDGANDGLVSESSFKWGEKYTFLTANGKRGISHGDVIDLNRENIKDFDVREFYVQLVSELKEKGL